MTVTASGGDLSIVEVVRVARHGEPVAIADDPCGLRHLLPLPPDHPRQSPATSSRSIDA
jgi:hypothetical protein